MIKFINTLFRIIDIIMRNMISNNRARAAAQSYTFMDLNEMRNILCLLNEYI